MIANPEVTVDLGRITYDERIMGGRPCVRGLRLPVSVVLKLVAGGMSREQILLDYPDLEDADIEQCLNYAAYLADEQVVLTAT